MSLLVVYHGGCRDGFAAAWCVWRKHPGAEFVGAQYGAPPPDVRGRDVMIVDFSYPLETMNQIAAECASLVVLDHHKTAEAALRVFSHPNAHVEFDMNRSGAGMTWDYLFPGEPRPWTVAYVEDRDLWRFALPDSRQVNEWLAVVKFDFEIWDREATVPVDVVVELGAAIELKTKLHVETAVKHARRVVIDGHDVPILNVTSDVSEIVGKLAETDLFAVGWFQLSDGRFSYSLRSRGDFDVSEVAKRRGGGGHKNAAGFVMESLL